MQGENSSCLIYKTIEAPLHRNLGPQLWGQLINNTQKTKKAPINIHTNNHHKQGYKDDMMRKISIFEIQQRL